MTRGQNESAEGPITVLIDQDLEEIVPGFLENRRGDVNTLERALKENDLRAIHLIGHRLKGDGGGYGFDAISVIGGVLEQAAAREDRVVIRRQIAELVDYLARVTVVYRR
ncbi:MAG: Hpt domain-containing protein [Nitrospirota bacterium]|jgi:HPt (histidine-containing phosphotransfer) domain-containing protein|nr:Hpt domain-containing protein [Nitrospirota bacterium]